ncbi:hypothetical protein L208DRAFT_1259662, partial [Tricholoma matsutake]
VTLAACTETLDNHMGDSNFKKMLDIVVVTCWCYKAAMLGVEDSHCDLAQYSCNAEPEEIKAWITLARKSQEDHLEDPTAMDIYDINVSMVAPTKDSFQLALLHDEAGSGAQKGEASWLSLGLILQEAQ